LQPKVPQNDTLSDSDTSQVKIVYTKSPNKVKSLGKMGLKSEKFEIKSPLDSNLDNQKYTN
jgi:hypothetical protein